MQRWYNLIMNREELPRIRLKVATNAGINILCTALRSWRVVDWLPHIEQAYREVKEDQEDDEPSKQRFIRALRIKKGEFYIANSELVGDIFEDNDEVQCEITFPTKQAAKAKQPKKEKQSKKRNLEEIKGQEKPVREAPEKEREVVEEKPKKRVKKDTIVMESSEKKEKHESKKEKKEPKSQEEVKKETKEEKEEKKFQLLKHLDLNHLKSLISSHNTPTSIPHTPKVVEIFSSDHESDS